MAAGAFIARSVACFSIWALVLGGCGTSPSNSSGNASASSPTPSPAVAASPPTAESPAQVTPPVVSDTTTTPTDTYQVVNTFPHDRAAFTQGLLVDNGVLYESTGLEGRSSLRKDDLATGKVDKKVDVASTYFAEGLAQWKGKLYQLTWKAHKGFIYDQTTFKKTGTFGYTGEGWGLTHDDKNLILSDGTNQIRFLDPQSFAVVRTISVTDRGAPIDQLNELEYIKGEIWANVWQQDYIIRIDPTTGKIKGWIDMTGLLPAADRDSTTDVLNGIAYDAIKDRILVTGKLWPKIFEIKVVPKTKAAASAP